MPLAMVTAGRLVLVLAALSTASLVHANETQAFRTALESITVDDLGRHVDVLADDTFEGREAGSRGGKAAGGYLLQLLQENDIRGGGTDGSYYQPFGNGYRNILGMIEGSDPKLKHEYILIGAHYDHVGYGTSRNSFGPTGYIHNGADDNASGTAGLVEVMQAFSNLPRPPRRSILFAFWDGEEKGLLGSKHWVNSPTIRMDQLVFAFNVDMIGRLQDDRVEVYGSRTAPGLRQVVSRQNGETGLELDFIWDVKPNSDHYTFFERDIPFVMFHTGLHDDYHRPSDDPETINQEGMRAVSQLMFRTAYALSQADATPSFRNRSRHESGFARRQLERTLPPAPPRLGVSWSREETTDGLTITRVASGSPAAQAEFRPGDRIVGFDGYRVENGDQFLLIVLAAPSQTSAQVVRTGEPEPIELTVLMPGEPVRLGISWDDDNGNPAMVILTRVVPGSAAAQAGLNAKDRVYKVAGRNFADALEFGQLVTHHEGPLDLLVERDGLLRDVTIQPLTESHADNMHDVAPPAQESPAEESPAQDSPAPESPTQ